MDKRGYEERLAKAERDNADLGWRLALAQSAYALMCKAYDALQAYGIDYRKLHTYPLWEKLLPVGKTYDDPVARSALTNWVQRCMHDIDAAVRRKTSLKLAVDNEPDPEHGI